MYVDFAIISTDINDKQAKQQISEVIKLGVDGISLPFYLIKVCKNLIDTEVTDLSCFIDYPLGVSDTKTRVCAVQQAISIGVNTVDITMAQNLAANRKYDKIREDIEKIQEVCLESKTKIRFILEYRLFDHRCLKKICEIFDSYNIQYAFPSTGFFLDNLSDNLIACSFLHQNSKEINIICSGDSWLEKHFNIVYKSGIYGLRSFSPYVIKEFQKFLLKQNKQN